MISLNTIQEQVSALFFTKEEEISTWNGKSIKSLGDNGVVAGGSGLERIAAIVLSVLGGAFLITAGIAAVVDSYAFIAAYGSTFMGTAAVISVPTVIFFLMYG